MPDGPSASRPVPSESAQHGVFINVTVDASVASDADLAKRLEEACPVDIFAATDTGVQVVGENLDECVLCGLCLDAAPDGTVTVTKLYDGTTLDR
jgi:NAD-dependent dihydropyrimidine dehydrogenase PreA subunit